MKQSKLIVGSLLLTSLAMGQEGEVSQQATSDQANKAERITVTGSRIKKIDIEGASSVTRFSRDDLDNSSFGTVAEFLQNNIPSGAFTNENFTLSQVAGSSSFGGRDQTASYTLVLVNGRRMPTNAIADSFVDLNLVPLAAVETIEYLTDGASAIYGSDAVAGVLNIILKKNFDGTSVKTRFGQASRGDATTTSVQVVSGASGEKSNLLFAYDYYRREPINAINRPLIKSAISPEGDDQRSPNGTPGYVILNDGTQIPFPDCPASDVNKPFAGACAYDFAPLYQVIPLTERNSFYTSYNQDLTPDLSIFAEARYSRVYTLTANGAAPGGVNLSASAPSNPYGEDVFLVRRYIDFGPREKDNTNEVFSITGGIQGYLTDTWAWDFSYSSHKLRNTQNGAGGQINSEKASQYFNDGTLNPFEFNEFDTDAKRLARDDIDTEIFREGTSKLDTYNVGFSGELPVALPGGDIAMATGAEYREEEFLDRSDVASTDGIILGAAGGNAGGRRDNKAAYLEFSFPVLDSLDVNLAARHDILNSNKEATTYAASTSYRPIESVLLRASYGTGFKAPDLHQLYLGRSFGVGQSIDYALCESEGSCEVIEINTESSGNADLDPEKSVYLNIGAVVQATSDFSFNLDYWNLKIEDKVEALPLTFILQNEGSYADLIQRVNGRLTLPDSKVLTPLDNVSEEESAGIELGMAYASNIAGGKVSTNLTLNKVLVSKSPTGPGEPLCDYADRQKGFNANAKAGWRQDNYGVNLAMRYFGPYTTYNASVDPGGCELSDSAKASEFDVAAYYEFDLGATYVINEMFDVGAGIQNLFDEEPAFDKNGVFSVTGIRGWPFYDQERSSNIGRFFYMSLNANLN